MERTLLCLPESDRRADAFTLSDRGNTIAKLRSTTSERRDKPRGTLVGIFAMQPRLPLSLTRNCLGLSGYRKSTHIKRTSREGRFTPAGGPTQISGHLLANSGGEPPFLTCSFPASVHYLL